MAVTPPPTTWLRYLLGGCGRTVGRILLWTLWFVLGVILVFQLRIYFAREIELPGLLLRHFEKKAAERGVALRIGGAHFDAQGHVVLDEVSAAPGGVVGPTLQCGRLEVRVNPLLATAGVFDVRSVRASQVRLSLPAPLSPTGVEMELVHGGEFFVLRTGDQWSLAGGSLRVGDVLFEARGPLPVPPGMRPGQTSTPALAVDWPALNRLLKRVAEQSVQLRGVTEARFAVQLQPAGEKGPVARLEFSAERIVAPQPLSLPGLGTEVLEARHVRLSTELTAWTGLPPLVHTEVGSALWGNQLSAGSLTARVGLNSGAPTFVASADVEARALRARGDELPFALVTWRPSPDTWEADLITRLWSEPLLAHWRGAPRSRSGSIHLETAVSENLLRGASRHANRDLGAILQPSAPAPLSLDITLAPDGRPLRASGRLDSGAVGVRGVALLGAAADIRWEGNDLGFDRILLVAGGSVVRGSYWMDTRDYRYQFLLNGSFRPESIAPWFKEWWPRFWGRFHFGRTPQANVSIEGRWGHPLETSLFLGIDAPESRVRDATFDRVRTELFVRPHFVRALWLNAEEGNGRATGSFSRKVDLNRETDALDSIEFDLSTSLPLQKFTDLFGEEARSLVSPYELALPPRLKGSGWLHGPAHPDGPDKSVDLEVRSWGNLRYLGFPLQDFSAKVAVRGDTVTITGVRTNFAGGRVRGDISVSGAEPQRSIVFDGHLTGANLGEAIRTLDEFGAQRTPSTNEVKSTGPGGRFQRELAAGLLSVDLRARGYFGDPYSFMGTGKASVYGSTLGEINMLGQLSSLLKGVPVLNFTSVTLNQATSDFELKGSELYFPKLRITGPSAEILAKGSYFLRTKKINLDAKVYPFASQHNFFASTFDLVLTPLSSALELRLEGSLDKPSWYFTHGPTSFLKMLTPSSGPATSDKP